MHDFRIKLACENKTSNISGWDWYRLQSHILKHMVCNKNEIWEDIFPLEDLKKIREDLQQKGCKGLKKTNNIIELNLCANCNCCKESPPHIEFREKVYQYIQGTLSKEKTGTYARHSHQKKEKTLSIIADEGATIIFKKKYHIDGYCFCSIYIGSDYAFKDLYLSSLPQNRHFILKDIALNTFRSQNQSIHYQDNFRK